MAIAFHKKFIAGVAALAICVTGAGATQAQAGNRDAEHAIAAILGLAVIGAIIAEERKDKRRKEAHVTRNNPIIIAPHRTQRPVRIEPRPLPNRVHRHSASRILPQRCLREVNTHRGVRYVFGARCMNRHFPHVGSLPQRCERQLHADRGPRFGWSARCLNKHGYQMARR